MSSIHYIWWGNPGTPELLRNATATPNIMVEAVHGTHDVHYWIGGDRGFDGQLDPRIHLHFLGSNPAQLLSGSALVGQSEKFNQVLNSLDQFRAFAATKDLVSFAVMYSRGGFFFDTTTQISEGYRPHIKRLLAESSVPRAPYNADDSVGSYFVPNDETSRFTIDFGTGPGAMFGYPDQVKKFIPNFDVWALYSSQRYHAVFRTAVSSYLRRAENIGFLNPSTTQVEGGGFGKQLLSTIMNQRLTDQEKAQGVKPPRDKIIGGMAISSLLTGLWEFSSQNGKTLQDLGWPFVFIQRDYLEKQKEHLKKVGAATPMKKESFDLQVSEIERKAKLASSIFSGMGLANVTVPTIGIQKWFSGSWRAKNL